MAIPAGPATIRFEGVAGGILAESAIVAGLPEGAREKNLDADLLSPRTLFDRSLGRRVVIRRTDRATGRVPRCRRRSARRGTGGMVLTTAEGVEAIQCAGVPEKIVYDWVPAGLSAKPTLSIATDSPVARTVTLTLSYLAGGFDWQANYVATMRPDGTSADLIAWLTLVSGDVTSFVDAGTQVVAGKPNRVGAWNGGVRRDDGAKDYRCWRTGPPNSVAATAATASATAAHDDDARPGDGAGGRDHRHRVAHRPAGGARRLQTVPRAAAGDGRRAIAEAGRAARQAGGAGAGRLHLRGARRDRSSRHG